MISARRLLCVLPVFLATALPAQDDSFRAPDSIVLKDGRVIKGLIIKNTRDAVLIQEKFDETSYPKSEIVRIRDEANVNVEFTDIIREGDLPSWRVIVNDLRTNDTVREMVEIPATLIDNGEFKNVPYKSFRINNDVELNIYGDPEDPAGIELGIYGLKSNSDKLRRVLRAYLAGFLSNREEVAALYALNFKGEIKTVGSLTLEITPRDAPDAYGAWWISLYNKKNLASVRLDDAEYAQLTRPFNEVVGKGGRVQPNAWTKEQADLNRKDDSNRFLLRGFYRDKNGDFRLLSVNTSPKD